MMQRPGIPAERVVATMAIGEESVIDVVKESVGNDVPSDSSSELKALASYISD